MQKLLELTSKDWMSGISVSGHMPGTGLFSEASGINPFVNPRTTTYQTGLLQTSEAPTEIQGAVVDDEIIGAAYRGSAYTAYLSGDAGNIYSLSTSTYTTPTELQTGITSPNLTDGLELFAPKGGSTKLYYWQNTQIGTFDLASTWTDNAYTGLEDVGIHPTHQFLGNVYYGNENYVGFLQDAGGQTVSNTTQALDLAENLMVTTLDDDGYYLVIGATSNRVSGNLQVNTLNKILFWDTYSNSWQKEYQLPVAGIHSIRRVGETMIALTTDGLYAFSFAMKPRLILPLSNADTGARTPGADPTNNLAISKNDVFYWASGKPDICAYGSPLPGLSPRFFRPFKAIGTVPSYLAYPDKFKMIAAGATGKLATIDTQNTGNTSLTAETIYIPLGRKYDIKKIEIITGEPLASGDDVAIKLQSDEDNSETEFGDFTFAKHGAARSHLITGAYQAENLKIIASFDGGDVKIKKLTIYGEPMTIT